MTSSPLVLTPQHFGSLVFERHTSRYLPFDDEATALLRALARRPFQHVIADAPVADHPALEAFFSALQKRPTFALLNQTRQRTASAIRFGRESTRWEKHEAPDRGARDRGLVDCQGGERGVSRSRHEATGRRFSRCGTGDAAC